MCHGLPLYLPPRQPLSSLLPFPADMPSRDDVIGVFVLPGLVVLTWQVIAPTSTGCHAILHILSEYTLPKSRLITYSYIEDLGTG